MDKGPSWERGLHPRGMCTVQNLRTQKWGVALLRLKLRAAEKDAGGNDRKGRSELGTADLGLEPREPSHQ